MLERFFGGDGGDDLPRLSPKSGPAQTRLVLEGLVRIGLGTSWRAGPPEGVHKHELRAACGMAVGRHPEVNIHGFNKVDLVALCDVLGIDVDRRDTTRDMRRAIARRAGLEYESPDRIRDFSKEELQAVTMRVARAAHEGGRL